MRLRSSFPFVCIALLLSATQSLGVDKDEVRKAFALERGETVVTSKVKDVFAFERMKLRSDYPNDLQKATKEGQLFVLWVAYEDASLYGWFLETLPDAIHSFDADVDASKGLTIGRVKGGKVECVRELDAYTLSAPKIKEVILTLVPNTKLRPWGAEPHPFSGFTRAMTAPDKSGMGPSMSGAVMKSRSSPAFNQTAITRMDLAPCVGQFGSTSSV